MNKNNRMPSDQVHFDLGGEFEDGNYKSCFARSVAVNSQTKSLDFKQLRQDNSGQCGEVLMKPCVVNRPFTLESQDAVRLRKTARIKIEETRDSRRFSCSNITSNRRPSTCSSRLADIPVENMVNQSKIDTLQWQLKEIQKSRDMYRAVMMQVVTFLEKAHHSLELLGSRINQKNPVSRSKSEHQIVMERSRGHNDSANSTLTPGLSCLDDYLAIKDFAWRQSKGDDPSPDEIPPEKLSKEAFRLYRTAQSLLNTREPDLVQMRNQQGNDVEFLAQLAKEFPNSEPKPLRATSFFLSPKLIQPEAEVKISTAFNRKLSLQLSEVRRNSEAKPSVDSARGSVAENDAEFLNDNNVYMHQKNKSDKSNSPATGSISSVEDESGFSSMNSFQDVGLPMVNSTMCEEVSTKRALLRSMLHSNSDYSSLNLELNSRVENVPPPSNSVYTKGETTQKSTAKDYKLWQRPQSATATPQHRRWNSSPSEDVRNQSLNVLWV